MAFSVHSAEGNGKPVIYFAKTIHGNAQLIKKGDSYLIFDPEVIGESENDS